MISPWKKNIYCYNIYTFRTFRFDALLVTLVYGFNISADENDK
jgi:hypothetical protein